MVAHVVAAALTRTGDETVELFVGLQMVIVRLAVLTVQLSCAAAGEASDIAAATKVTSTDFWAVKNFIFAKASTCGHGIVFRTQNEGS